MTDDETLAEAPIEPPEQGGEMTNPGEQVLTLSYQQGDLTMHRVMTLDVAEELATDILAAVAKARAKAKAEAVAVEAGGENDQP